VGHLVATMLAIPGPQTHKSCMTGHHLKTKLLFCFMETENMYTVSKWN